MTAERQNDPGSASTGADQDEAAAQLKKERDIYEQELEKLTQNFTVLKKEKVELEQQIATLRKDIQGAKNPATDQAGQAQVASVWGATAIDDSGAIFAVSNQATKKAAQNGAAAKCQSQSGFGCMPLTAYRNSCFSVARFEGEGPAIDNYAFSTDSNWKRSAAEALGRCERMGQACTVRFTACSPENLSK
nr:DUF4189 domain-containing protein [Rhizobium setariae]